MGNESLVYNPMQIKGNNGRFPCNTANIFMPMIFGCFDLYTGARVLGVW